jgi:hypothetical protein
MATRSRTTFQKRQKEMARAEKQREKAARRLQRKSEEALEPEPELVVLDGPILYDTMGDPIVDDQAAADNQPASK